MTRGDLGLFAPVEQNVLSGRALLWLVMRGTAIRAAVVTELHRTETRKVCTIVACGGADMRDWLALLSGIENFARAEGCDAVRVMGRAGWTRMLKEYRETRVVLERKIV
jgi:hypothetical protein